MAPDFLDYLHHHAVILHQSFLRIKYPPVVFVFVRQAMKECIEEYLDEYNSALSLGRLAFTSDLLQAFFVYWFGGPAHV